MVRSSVVAGLFNHGQRFHRGGGHRGPCDLPSNEAIEVLIDRLSASWSWPVVVAAAYGCRPHEALLFAEVLPSGLLRIAAGKTGARQSLALPAFNPEHSHRDVGALMGQAFRRAGADFRPYDFRHAWAVRAIHNSKVSPSLAAKSMDHSLAAQQPLPALVRCP